MDLEVRLLSKELRPVKSEINLTVSEVVRDQAETRSSSEYSKVAGLSNH